MKQSSMFTPPEPEQRKPSAPAIPAAQAHERPQFGAHVARAITHHRGVFRRVREGHVVDEFYIVEMTNGNIVEQTTKGEVRPADIARGGVEQAREIIASGLATGLWRVVE